MYTNTIKAILLNQKKLFELAKIAFESVDITKSGEIDEIDLGKVLVDISKNLGGDPPTQEDINEVMKHLDADRSGTIDLNEFMDLMNNKLKEQQEGQELLETFQVFDKDADGQISAEDLRYVIKAVGEELEDDLIDQLIEQGDLDQDGKINYHEFVRIMTAK